MNTNQYRTFTQTNFVILWSAIAVKNNDKEIIEREVLENDLVDEYKTKSFEKLFEDVVLKNNNIDREYVDLSVGFTGACIFGAITKIEIPSPEKYIINLDDEISDEIISSFDEEIISDMQALYNNINKKRQQKSRNRY